MTAWGTSLHIDAYGLDARADDEQAIEWWCADLVKLIGMTPIGGPVVRRCKLESRRHSGVTVFQLIVQSNITAHFCWPSAEGFIEVFSCRKFDPETVYETLRMHFAPTRIAGVLITRGDEVMVTRSLS